MYNIQLIYPKDFTSTQTYQNSNYAFPHTNGLSLNYEELINWFISDYYVLNDYITYGNGYSNINYIKNQLSKNDNFTILGATFMRLKTFEEFLYNNMFITAIDWKNTHKHSKFQKEIDMYITDYYNNELKIIINTTLNYIQIMIINIINFYIKNNNFPVWLNNDITNNLIELLQKYLNLTTINIPVGNVIYLIKSIPLLILIYNILNSNYIIN
jgi:hypothetical protein